PVVYRVAVIFALEQVAQVRAAAPAARLGAAHAVAVVGYQLDRVFVGRHVERRPAAVRIELVIAAKQLSPAGAATVDADRLGVGVLADVRGFGGGLAQHGELGRRQLGAPFILGFLDLIHDAKRT